MNRDLFPHLQRLASRRRFLHALASGCGGIALQSLMASDAPWSPPSGHPHHRPRANRVIWIFLRGGLSHMESFDPKPALNQYAGKTIAETPYRDVQSPERLKRVRVVVVNDANGQQRTTIYPLQTGFRQYGQSGAAISDWFPHIGSCADDIAIVRSMWTTDDNHGAQVQFHSGRHMLDPREPTIGAWINYGLASMSDNLPRFVNIGPRFFDVRDGHYLGPAYDAVNLRIDPANPLAFASPEIPAPDSVQSDHFQLVRTLDQLVATEYPEDTMLAARLQSYELAFRMQRAVPEMLAFDKEPESVRKLYGLDQKHTESFGRQLLAARRMAERGVRFIQIQHGDGAAGAWDAHGGLRDNHSRLSAEVDLPTAGLLKDLKARGMLDDTIVVFATEFGRTPGSQGSDGRDHHPYGFSIWMAGGGIRGGIVHGSTDELGFHATESPHYVTDVHATIYHLLGINARQLEIPGHRRLDRDYGSVISPILA
jgi:hypothetical protein